MLAKSKIDMMPNFGADVHHEIYGPMWLKLKAAYVRLWDRGDRVITMPKLEAESGISVSQQRTFFRNYPTKKHIMNIQKILGGPKKTRRDGDCSTSTSC